MRRCSKTACPRAAVATLTYNYGEQTAVLGPLATYAEPHTYDLCATHGERMTVPKGWEVLRLVGPLVERDETDDLLAVADAVNARRPVRGAEARRRTDGSEAPDEASPGQGATRPAGRHRSSPGDGQRPILRVLRDQ